MVENVLTLVSLTPKAVPAMTLFKTSLILLATAPCLLAQNVAVLDFDFQHGTVINNQYADLGVNISITSDGNADLNIGIVYDSELGGTDGGTINGADTDLERLSGGGGGAGNAGGWTAGNIPDFATFNAGGLLIIQENDEEAAPPTFGTGPNQVTSASNFNPDDNGCLLYTSPSPRD